MAVTPDSKGAQSQAGQTVSREEFQELLDQNTQLELQVQELAATLDLIQKAQTVAGVDPQASTRRALGRTPVQFKENYNRLPQPSTVKDAPNLVDGYTVGKFGVVNLRDDEVARILADFPGLIEVDKSKFVPFPKRTPFMEKDEHGRSVWGSKLELIDVKTLLAKAPNAA